MKASELRIGNLVYLLFSSGNKEMSSVDSICPEGIDLQIKGEYYHSDYGIEPLYTNDEIAGIPLTEEWLVKFGFEIKGGYAIKKIKNVLHGDYIYSFVLDFSEGDYTFSDSSNLPRAPVQYIHQLQNLYFALTGEELTIK